MNRSTVESVAVVVALTDPATPAFRGRLARFAEEVGPFGEVLLVDASGTSVGQEAVRGLANVRVISRPVGRLAPVLWRDGLLATDAALVAFTTAQMNPRAGWLGALKNQLRSTNAAGVGGPIETASGLSKTDQAVALLRYSSYFPSIHSTVDGSVGWAPPTKNSLTAQGSKMVGGAHPTRSESLALHASPSLGPFLRVDPPGDNSLYCRDRLMEVESSWINGFWEVAVHKALRDRGENLAMAESAVITYEGGIGLRSMILQRLRHAWRYGAERSQGKRLPIRVGRSLGAPIVPLVLCLRIVKSLRVQGIRLRPWISALPRLILLASAWAIGEAVGTLVPLAWSKSMNEKRDLVTHFT